ncbi:hypothetical protein [Streptomyces antnestii]|uniref:hypothetical protein n=1 Tax=Streptomyces antnestii TaxID=2494256 RepID=UPI001677DD1D|nr:hypothetical protein [Streptomyces sp. San01]
MSTCGAGGIGDVLGVLTPEAGTQSPDGPGFASMAGETVVVRQTGECEGGSDGVDAGPGRVLVWGAGSGAGYVGWLIVGDDPDKWPVIVWERHGWLYWKIYGGGVTELLRCLFTMGFDECPLSGASLWGEATPHFLHWREGQRRWDSGIDPCTGEPDPCFGMEFD